MNFPKNKVLTVFSLVMINVIAVDNLRSLPVSAQYGLSSVFYYLLAAFVFFIPSSLVAAELATGWPNTGGAYVWVREAFGARVAFLAIWMQWIYNVVWYPTMLAFLAAIFAYFVNPALANNKIYMLSVIISMFWIATIINLYGMKASSWMSTAGALIGTIIPMLFIILLGAAWIHFKMPIQIQFTWHDFTPNLSHFDNLSFLVAVFFGLMGMEMSAVHAEEVNNPQKNYPKALLYSTLIILSTLIFASLAIAVVLPHNQISLVSGLIDALGAFFNAFHLKWLIPILAGLIILGGLSGVSTWIIGPTKGLLVASQDGSLPTWFEKLNSRGAPVVLLISQGVLVTALCAVFLFMPNVNSSYWILTALTSQLALIFYLFLFAAAIKLRYSKPHQPRAYKIPGGKIGIWLVSGMAMIACVAVIIFGFLPPPDIKIGSLKIYEAILVCGLLLFCSLPFFIRNNHKKFVEKSWQIES